MNTNLKYKLVRWGCGSGDAVHFAHLLKLYARYGYLASVECPPDKHFIYESCGIGICKDGTDVEQFGFDFPPDFNHPDGTSGKGNRIRYLINHPPLPSIAHPNQAWQELCDIDLRGCAENFLTEEDRAIACCMVQGLPRPIVLVHGSGNSFPEKKNLPLDVHQELVAGLAKLSIGVIALDNELRIVRQKNVIHSVLDLGGLSVRELAAVYEQADLLIGVDSFPLHFSTMTNIPSLGVYTGFHPSCTSLPCRNRVNLTKRSMLNNHLRKAYNLIEYDELSAQGIAQLAHKMVFPESLTLDLACATMVEAWLGS